ncbi:DNA repair protein RecN [Corynebacterium choanae]|nr:DNA repair protein RecN [Corynebacterium choanae]
MLVELSITNVGVIPHTTVEFAPGFTCLTGETGAGKTMIITGLKMICGQRSEPAKIRAGANQAVVEGVFSLADVEPQARQQAEFAASEAGAQADENNEYVVVRTMARQGRSKAHLSGRTVPAATLAQFTSPHISLHGQMDQIAMLDPQQQRAVVDSSNPTVAQCWKDYRAAYRRWRELDRQLTTVSSTTREAAQEVDRLQFAIHEIESLNPQPGEDEELRRQIQRLQDVDMLRQAASTAVAAIDGDPESFDDHQAANALLAQAEHALAASEDPVLQAAATRLAALLNELGDIAGELTQFHAQLDADPATLEQLLSRSQALKQLTRKYAPDIDGVLQWKAKAEKKLAAIDVSPAALQALREQTTQAAKVRDTAAKALTQARQAAAATLSKAVTQELAGLAMAGARLEVVLLPQQGGPYGAEEIEFRLAGAPGEPARPIGQAASGGELSRVMLALELHVAGSGGKTLIFDEVDAGVGGQAAVEIGKRLAQLARHNQVIVVTHLAQVAAFADRHITIAKSISEDQRAVSAVTPLEDKARVDELARMLAGLGDTDTGRAHAAELLAVAHRSRGSKT